MNHSNKIILIIGLYSLSLILMTLMVPVDNSNSLTGNFLGGNTEIGFSNILSPFIGLLKGMIKGIVDLLSLNQLNFIAYVFFLFIFINLLLTLAPGSERWFKDRKRVKTGLSFTLSLMIFFAMGGVSGFDKVQKNFILTFGFVLVSLIYIWTFTTIYDLLFNTSSQESKKDNLIHNLVGENSSTSPAKYVVSGIVAVIGIFLTNLAAEFFLRVNIFSTGSFVNLVIDIFNMLEFVLILYALFSVFASLYVVYKTNVYHKKDERLTTYDQSVKNQEEYLKLKEKEDSLKYQPEIRSVKQKFDNGINYGKNLHTRLDEFVVRINELQTEVNNLQGIDMTSLKPTMDALKNQTISMAQSANTLKNAVDLFNNDLKAIIDKNQVEQNAVSGSLDNLVQLRFRNQITRIYNEFKKISEKLNNLTILVSNNRTIVEGDINTIIKKQNKDNLDPITQEIKTKEIELKMKNSELAKKTRELQKADLEFRKAPTGSPQEAIADTEMKRIQSEIDTINQEIVDINTKIDENKQKLQKSKDNNSKIDEKIKILKKLLSDYEKIATKTMPSLVIERDNCQAHADNLNGIV